MTAASAGADRPERRLPSWFDDAKLGIFIHWSAAAIPAFAPIHDEWPPPTDDPRTWVETPYAESYQDCMAIPGSPTARHHAEHYGPDVTFDHFVRQFREGLAHWDADTWADLFEHAGARYVVLCAKLEDGFLLWPSAHPHPTRTEWQSERDIVGELADAVRARGMRFGVYYSGFDWAFSEMRPGLTSWDECMEAHPRSKEYADQSEAHWRELIRRYEPDVLWADAGYAENADTQPNDLFRFYRETVPEGVVNDRWDELRADGKCETVGDYKTYEYKVDFSNAVRDRKWEANRGFGRSFGFNRQDGDHSYLSQTQLVRDFADIVARGGNLLLNMGPTGAGEAPWGQAARLVALGWWLRRYGSAIYGTRRWERPAGITADGLSVRYTASGDAVHAIVLGTPGQTHVELDVRLDEPATVSIAGRSLPLPWDVTDHGTRIELPEQPDEQPAIALRLAPAGSVRAKVV